MHFGYSRSSPVDLESKDDEILCKCKVINQNKVFIREYKGQVLLQNHLKTITSTSKDLYMGQTQINNIIHLPWQANKTL